MNGNNGNYFKTYRGLRQGDPLSPLLFNLVADALHCMLTKAKSVGLLRGVTQNLVERGLTHLQYADDTVIMMEADEESIRTMKMILYC